jgi:hypothetical protein
MRKLILKSKSALFTRSTPRLSWNEVLHHLVRSTFCPFKIIFYHVSYFHETMELGWTPSRIFNDESPAVRNGLEKGDRKIDQS